MTASHAQIFESPQCFTTATKTHRIAIKAFSSRRFDEWLKEQDKSVALQVDAAGFNAEAGTSLYIYNDIGAIYMVLAGISEPLDIYDLSALPAKLRADLSTNSLNDTIFTLEHAEVVSRETLLLSWALGTYEFTRYKPSKKPVPQLYIPSYDSIKQTQIMYRAIALVRNLVNTPANDMGPADLEDVASELAGLHKAKLKVIKGSALEKGFPLVQAVGQAAIKERAPRVLELTWGDKTHPAITIIGKGVCFDTGGLDLKPSQYMALMKKDMGGAAHALALAHAVMASGFPVQIRVIIPAVENAVSGNAFRPGDVFTSRSGLTVENTDTDAEGRLILADALAYAAEQKTDLIVDFATLTGSARAALGMDIPAFFTNDTVLEGHIKDISHDVQDPLWPMPLHRDYRKILKSNIADLTNHAAVPGDLIYSAIFLEHFVECQKDTTKVAPKWVHIDCFAWEQAGRAGRPKGGRDTGLRALYSVIETLYTI